MVNCPRFNKITFEMYLIGQDYTIYYPVCGATTYKILNNKIYKTNQLYMQIVL